MTHEEFKDICLKEFPLIEGMVKTVKALGAKKVSCDVWEDGHITFDITTQDNFFTAYHASTAEKGSLNITTYDIKRDLERGLHFENAKYLPECFYETIPEADPDTTEDDLPFV
jgi:hypothetical protein